jgi:predicted RNase H-like HicB family nuclease
MGTRSYSAVIFRHPRGMFVATCPAIPSAAGEGATIQEARDNLIRDVREALRAGEAEREDKAVITTRSVTSPIGSALQPTSLMTTYTYTVVVYPDTRGYTSLCPALGVASLGDSVDEALAMLTEAMQLQGKVERLPEQDTLVYIESLQVDVTKVGEAHAALA